MKQNEALEILKTGKNVFLTGEPGSGKTHTIKSYVSYLKKKGVEPAVTASTGIAATHIEGHTIHSWSGIGIKNELSPYELESLHEKKQLVKRVNGTGVLIIDEISMLDGVALNSVDRVLRSLRRKPEPFGGMQVVFSGDFFQLPPISSDGEARFAFGSPAWRELKPLTCYIEEQYRQTDNDMRNVLKALRSGFIEDEHIQLLNTRICNSCEELPATATKMYSHNADVDRINKEELDKLSGKEEIFDMESKGRSALVEKIKKGCLSPERLVLKEGAVVMCTKNNFEKGFVNGTLGVVKYFERRTRYPVIETDKGRTISIPEMDWQIEEDGKVLAKVTQIPLRLAWAITVHKSQGVSLDSAVVDLSRSFEYGQGYVALSRVRTLDGLFCLGLNDRALQVHPEIAGMDRKFRRHSDAVRKKFLSIEKGKTEKMRINFLRSLGGDDEKTFTAKTKKESTYDKTAALVAEANSLKELAQKRDLTVSTILRHLEQLLAEKKIEKEDILKFWTSLGRSEKDLEKVHGAFTSEGETVFLKPAFRKLKGKFSFEELQLAKALLY
ncbi:MAG: AAA family ATPase [Candidatus Paceibacterota bacterium]